MELRKIIEDLSGVSISESAAVTQLTHEEDGEAYQVWKLVSDKDVYILKQAKGCEAEIYRTLLSQLDAGVPRLYGSVKDGADEYILIEYIEGENLSKCDRARLTRTLDALISIQKATWEDASLNRYGNLLTDGEESRKNRGRYLNDPTLEKAYERFLKVYERTQKALCHDDLLPFNAIATDDKAVLIDWEHCGFLPYPTPLARLIAYGEEKADALFYMTEEDKAFAVEYYYKELLEKKGIQYTDWLDTFEHFLFYEYCEWVFVGNKYDAREGEYFRKYLPIALEKAEKLLKKTT